METAVEIPVEITGRTTYSVTTMARRSRKTEVLLSGDAVENRQRFQTRVDAPLNAADIAAAKPAPEHKRPPAETHADGSQSAHERLRRQPKVIDARKHSDDAQTWDDEPLPNPVAEPAPVAHHAAAPADIELFAETAQPQAEVDIAPAPKPAPAPPTPQPKPAGKPAAATPAPKAPTPKQPARKTPTPKQSSRVAAKTMVESMVGRLRAETQRKGAITADDLEALQAEFDRQAEKLSLALERSFDSYVEARERAEWGMKRELPFDRIIVITFSELFMEQDFSRFDRVSRRMLPGFFLALNMMLGEDLVEEYQEQCQLIVSRLREERGEDFDWEMVYHHQQAKAVMLDAAATIASYFADYERRSTWFIDLINGHLGSLEGAPREEAGWEMTPAGFKRFLDRLFADLRQELATDTGKLRITKRHGAETCASIFEILETIET